MVSHPRLCYTHMAQQCVQQRRPLTCPSAHAPLTSRGKHVLHENEDGLLGAQLYPLADDVHKLPDGQV